LNDIPHLMVYPCMKAKIGLMAVSYQIAKLL
jgi:hypothetical protein